MANIFGGTPAFDAECRTSYAVAANYRRPFCVGCDGDQP